LPSQRHAHDGNRQSESAGNFCINSDSTCNFYVFQADSIQSLVFKIKYLLPDENTLSYVLNLSNDRTIILNIYIYGVPADSYVLSVFDHNYRLNLGYVYIGLKEPPVQAYWLYNNTTQAVPYKLDELEIIKLCNDDGFTVLKCLNSMGFLKPHSAAPILFKFWPIEVKTYKVGATILADLFLI
jgi:hypothetical protein